MLMRKTPKQGSQEAGFASIVVALILIIVLALLSVAFAQLSRREQQSALDKQLANQAFYAAESGINDAAQGIQIGINSPGDPKAITSATLASNSVNPNNCLTSAQLTNLGLNQDLDPTHGVEYTCMLLNLTPPTLTYGLNPGSSRSATFTPSPAPPAGSTFSLTVQWGSGDATPQTHFFNTAAASKFPTSAAWNTPPNASPPVLEFSLTPITSNGSIDRNSLMKGTFTSYMYPSISNQACPPGVTAPGGGTTSCVTYPGNPVAIGAQAPIIDGACSLANRPQPCSVTLTGIPYNAGDSYLIHFLDFYDTASITVDGNATGGSLSFANAQDVIDVTGKARNVLKRIHVTLTPTPPNQSPSDAIQAQNVCKHFQTAPTSALNAAGTTFRDANGAVSSSGSVCKLDD